MTDAERAEDPNDGNTFTGKWLSKECTGVYASAPGANRVQAGSGTLTAQRVTVDARQLPWKASPVLERPKVCQTSRWRRTAVASGGRPSIDRLDLNLVDFWG